MREISGLKNSLQIMQNNFDELMWENNSLKDDITNGEREMLSLRMNLDRLDKDKRGMVTEIRRLEGLKEEMDY